MRRIPLALCGYGWAGWRLGPYGKARAWRLYGPDGTGYTAGEIAELRALQLDVDWLRMRVQELEAVAAGGLERGDVEDLRAAAAVLLRLSAGKAYRTVRPGNNAPAFPTAIHKLPVLLDCGLHAVALRLDGGGAAPVGIDQRRAEHQRANADQE